MNKLSYVAKRYEDDGSVYFETYCGCGCDKKLTVGFEDDCKICTISVGNVCQEPNAGIWECLKWRVKTAWSALRYGSISGEDELIIKNEEHFKDIVNAMEFCAKKLRVFDEVD